MYIFTLDSSIQDAELVSLLKFQDTQLLSFYTFAGIASLSIYAE